MKTISQWFVKNQPYFGLGILTT